MSTACGFWLDPNRLASRRLTATDVVHALREQNVQVAAGVLERQPAPADTTRIPCGPGQSVRAGGLARVGRHPGPELGGIDLTSVIALYKALGGV